MWFIVLETAICGTHKHLTVSHWNPHSWSPTPNGVAWGIGCSVYWFSTTVLEPEVAKEVTVEAGIPSLAGVRDVTTSWVLGRLAVLSIRLPVAIVLLAWLCCERWITLSAGLKDSWVTQSYCWLLFGCQFSFNSYVYKMCMYLQLLASTGTCIKDVLIPSFETKKSTQADHKNNNE